MLAFAIRQLDAADLSAIMMLERASFEPAIQASDESVRKRLELGHIFLGVRNEQGKLIGKICFSYTHFSPDRPEDFPRTFKIFSHLPMATGYNAAFVYNLDVHPRYRRTSCARGLISAMIERSTLDGCRYVVVDGRPLSYNGSERDKVAQNPVVKAAIDRYLSGGGFPTDRELTTDPLLGLYRLMSPTGQFLWIIPDFLTEDEATGGLRVIRYIDLSDTEEGK